MATETTADMPAGERAFEALLERIHRLGLACRLGERLVWGAVGASATAFLLVGVDKLLWLHGLTGPLAAGSGLVWMTAAVLGWMRSSGLLRGGHGSSRWERRIAAAEVADERLHLDDRLLSAASALAELHLNGSGAGGDDLAAATRREVIEVGLHAAEGLRARRVVAVRIGRRAWAAPVLLILAGLLAWRTGTLDLLGRRKAWIALENRRRVVQQTAALASDRVRLLRRQGEKLPKGPAKDLTARLDELVRRLEKDPTDRREALLELSKLQQDIEDARRAVQPPAPSGQGREAAPKMSELGGLQQALEQGRYGEAKDEAAKLAQSAPSMADAQRQAAAADLEKLAQTAQSEPQLQQALQQAAQALQSGNAAQTQQALQQLQQAMSALQTRQQNAHALGQALSQIGAMKQCMGSPSLSQLQHQFDQAQAAAQESQGGVGEQQAWADDGANSQGPPAGVAPPPDGASGESGPGQDRPGQGSSGTGGQGMFRRMESAAAMTGGVPLPVRTKLQKGEISGILSFRGAPRTNTEAKELREMIEAGAPGGASAEALPDQRLPRSHQDLIRRYFESLRSRPAEADGPR